MFISLGLLNRVAKFKYFKTGIYVPLDIPDTIHVDNFSLYHGLREINFANLTYQHLRAYTLIDCGCAFGQVSMRMASVCSNLERIIAIDPNASHCEITRKNLSLTTVHFTVLNSAVSNFTGKGKLVFPRGEHDSHSAYIEANKSGDIEVSRLDDLIQAPAKHVALKLDVEGQEINAIKGAERIISESDVICIFVEIHPAVLKRNGDKGEEILRAVSSIRPMKWWLAENPLHAIDDHRPFFDQVDEVRQYDVMGVSE